MITFMLSESVRVGPDGEPTVVLWGECGHLVLRVAPDPHQPPGNEPRVWLARIIMEREHKRSLEKRKRRDERRAALEAEEATDEQDSAETD